MKKTILLFSLVAACLVSIGEPVKSMVGADGIEMNVDDYLPYDSKVEYLESTGTQWIDTGIVPQLFGVSKISIKPTVRNTVPWGCQNFTEISSYARYFTDKGLGGQADRKANTCYDIEINGATKQFITNGSVSKLSNMFFLIPASGNCWLFGRSDTGALGQLAIYSASFTDQAGILVRDLIPVRFTNENGETEGAMYDLVSQSLFTNQGTGSFVIGPDVE